jgi:hypothetical protein
VLRVLDLERARAAEERLDQLLSGLAHLQPDAAGDDQGSTRGQRDR